MAPTSERFGKKIRRWGLPLLLGVLTFLPAALGADGFGTVARFAFDGTLDDSSGAGRLLSASAPPDFVEGQQGQALVCNFRPLGLADAPDLRLAPGFTIDCWVYWEEDLKPVEQAIVRKAAPNYSQSEYLVRVSGHEDKRFSFFVNLGGLEPRVQGPVAKPKTWYHVVACWTGTEAVLEVNGERSAVSRAGVPPATTQAVEIGNFDGRLQNLAFRNVGLARQRQLAEASATTRELRLEAVRFGGADGWPGWQGLGGAQPQVEGGVLSGRLAKSSTSLVQPGLDVALGKEDWLNLELSAAARELAILFLTDLGAGTTTVPVWGPERTTCIDLAAFPGWGGHLKALAVAFPEGAAGELKLAKLWLSEKAEGRPYFYARSFAPLCAAPRAGREEQVQAVVLNLGGLASNVRAKLKVPAGLTLLDANERAVDAMLTGGAVAFTWKLRAEKAADSEISLGVSAPGAPTEQKALTLHVTPDLKLPKAGYVPPPTPAPTQTLNLMHYCALWKEGTHDGWGKVEPYPERRPAIGFYDEGTPEVADWHIKMALEHGIQGFIYCWYRKGYTPEIKQSLGHAIHDGLFKARYRDSFKFAIMWENGCADGVKGRDDLMDNLFPFWMTNYFKHPSYVKLDNRPLLIIWVPANVRRDLGKPAQVRAAFDAMRGACRRDGFDGLYIIACSFSTDPAGRQLLADEGYDATTAYNTIGTVKNPLVRDPEGLTRLDQAESMANQVLIWRGKKEVGCLPDIVNPTAGWDPRPWHGRKTANYYGPHSVTNFLACVRAAKELVDQTPGNGLDKRVVIFDNWNEFGEGHYIEPTCGYGFSFLDAIKAVFAPAALPCSDITPADVGLPYPEKVYLKRREILGSPLGGPLKVKDNLLSWWRFDDDGEEFALDSSGNHLAAIKDNYASTAGRVGKAFLSRGGTLSLGARSEFFPEEGVTIEAWVRVDEPKQADRWILNTISSHGSTGYRFGLSDGKLAFQVPKSAWSHMVVAAQPLPLGEWLHVAAVHDNENLRLYQGGVEVGRLKRGGPIAPADGKVVIGSFLPGLERNCFQGAIDELRIWTRALSAEEIAARYAEGTK